MKFNTADFKKSISKIHTALGVDKAIKSIKIICKENAIYFNVSTSELYLLIKADAEIKQTEIGQEAIVDGSTFVNLVSKLSSDTFELLIKEQCVNVKSNKSNYKLAIIDGTSPTAKFNKLTLINEEVAVDLEQSILDSIGNVNKKELAKYKYIELATELQRLYYLTEKGCLTITSGGCLNQFTLSEPIRVLLTDKIVQLFKIFTGDSVLLSYGHDSIEDSVIKQAKITIQNESVYLCALVPEDALLLSHVTYPYNIILDSINSEYMNKFTIDVAELSDAVSRLLLIIRGNNQDDDSMNYVPAKLVISVDQLSIVDSVGNSEIVDFEVEEIKEPGEYWVNLVDIKSILESFKAGKLTFGIDSVNNGYRVCVDNVVYLLEKKN